jgi:hypothetical protein
VGDELALRKELDGFKVLCGATNPYNYNGVSYNTYLTTGNWINDQSNPLVDWTDINATNALFSRMTDQETGNRIKVAWDTIVCSPTKKMTAQYIEAATEIETRTQSGAEIRRGPRLGDRYNIVDSVHLDYVLTLPAAQGGLALSQANADDYWWALCTQKGKLEIPEQSLVQLGEGIAETQWNAKWVLWDATLTPAPAENGTITQANGDVWRIKRVTRELWDTQWHCETRKDR